MRRTSLLVGAVPTALIVLTTACGETPSSPEQLIAPADASARGGPAVGGSYTFSPPVYDIDATPNGNILVAASVFGGIAPEPGQSTTTVYEIRRNGEGGVRQVIEIATPTGSPINGLAAVGTGSFFATRGGLDLAYAAAVLHASDGVSRPVADIEAYETANDPDATEGLAWKDPACEALGPFTAGPQSNPYHLARESDHTVLVADAAGNSLLRVSAGGEIELVATFSPPVEGGSASTSPDDWMGLVPGCFVQPVPTSVAVGPDGAIYVGELTGLTPANFGGMPSPGLSRVWRIEAGPDPVSCPSDHCSVAFSGLTSVIDLAFDPDGDLYAVEYDENGWALATGVGGTPDPAGGTVDRCSLATGTCEAIEEGLALPGAITFDAWGIPWILENNLGNPTVRALD